MATHYNFKSITPVPTASDFIDVILSKTQRKTPTVVHPGYKISRIRSFYMRKIKFTQQSYHDRLTQIITDFPKLDDIHPFYADLLNVLYDRDHYKLALGQISTARQLVDTVAKDYVRLVKFGDSLYRCKQLKRAALGRMCTIMKRQNGSLQYLEQVRQHLARLPSIDPNTRTLLLCGFPNVGKSSFMNKVTRADVEVQPYAFTTKSLFVGHLDYNYVRWQVIDTPGVLDQPLERRNTIEMQAITALAHLRACVLYLMDLSEQCGYSIAQQVALFRSIKALFANKPVLLVLNKIDLVRPDQLPAADQALLQELAQEEGLTVVPMSTLTGENITDVKTKACELLLGQRVEGRLRTGKVDDILNRLTVAMPAPRDQKERPAHIPAAALAKKTAPKGPKKPTLQDRYLMEGPDYTFDMREHYDLANEEWRHDVIPEIMDGKNIADFIDPDIMRRLEELEAEEEARDGEGVYEDIEDSEEEEGEPEVRRMAAAIRAKKALIVRQHREAKGANRPTVPRATGRTRTAKALEAHMASLGINTILQGEEGMAVDGEDTGRGRSRSRLRKRAYDSSVGPAESEVAPRSKSASRAVSTKRSRDDSGVRDVKQKTKARQMAKTSQRQANRMARAGEADRHITTKMPKHLFSGKRGGGGTDRR
eukprot:comp21303_c0_seq1/m.29120 comp21303_c0_seq1/g.29120  ORF comp21303_c0_seq1/g.29120 comp21303_c0_seq1/m.29120 type:complete len:651 (-) comp21303_c0_seq1:132-2084(-)